MTAPEPNEPLIYGERTDFYMSMSDREVSLFASLVKIYNPEVFDRTAERIRHLRPEQVGDKPQTGGAS